MGTKLTAAEAAERLRMSRATLNQLNYRGEGPPRLRISARRYLYDSDRLEEWLNSRELTGSTAPAAVA